MPLTENQRILRDYAVLRYSLEQIKRKIGSERYDSDEGVDPVDIQDIADKALSITSESKMPFVTDASIRRYIDQLILETEEKRKKARP